MKNRLRFKQISFWINEEQKEQLYYKKNISNQKYFNDFVLKCIFENRINIINFDDLNLILRYYSSIENNINQLIFLAEDTKKYDELNELLVYKTQIKAIRKKYLNLKKELVKYV